jgi:hypothetical protein
VNAGGVHQVAAEILHDVGALRNAGKPAAEREAHVVGRCDDVRAGKHPARERRLRARRVIVGHEEERQLGVRREPQQRADERPHPAGELPGSVTGDRDPHAAVRYEPP